MRRRGSGAEIRFIEYMDVGGATRWTPEQVFSRRDLLESLTRRFGAPVPLDGDALGAGGAVPAAARAGRRRDLVDDRAVLRDVRPQPPDGRRHVVPLPLRDQRHGPARARPRGRDRRRVAAADHRDVAGTRPIKARRIDCVWPTGGRLCRSRR